MFREPRKIITLLDGCDSGVEIYWVVTIYACSYTVNSRLYDSSIIRYPKLTDTHLFFNVVVS